MLTLQDTIQIVSNVLQLPGDAADMSADTALLGSVPEFDSMAVVAVLTAFEDELGIVIDDDEVSADIFETVGSLHDFVSTKAGG